MSICRADCGSVNKPIIPLEAWAMQRKLLTVALMLVFWVFPWEAISQVAGLTPCGAPITLSASSGSSTNAQLSACGGVVLLWNVGTQEAFYKYGSANTTAATTSDWSIPSASFVVLNLGTSRLYLAAITASSSTTLRITQGNAQ